MKIKEYMESIKQLFTQKKEYRTLLLVKYAPTFITVDGGVHTGNIYKYIDPNAITCRVPEYFMYTIKGDGYIKDDNHAMYPLSNVVKIEWNIIDYKEVVDDFYHEYKVVFSDEEVKKMKDVDVEKIC